MLTTFQNMQNITESNNQPIKNVGLLNFHGANNYGAVLVAWALQQAITTLGYNVSIINYNPLYYATNKSFDSFRANFLNTTKPYTKEMLIKETSDWDCIIVGSDQIWRLADTDTYMLDWASGKCVFASYGASFGTHDYSGSIPKSEAYRLLQRFDRVSVREFSGIKICREEFNCDAIQVLDPTLLLNPKDYDNLIKNDLEIRNKYPENSYICKAFYSRLNGELAINKSKLIKNYTKSTPIIDAIYTDTGEIRSIEEWLTLIKNAKFILTDSFHACVFSILYHKQFIPFIFKGTNGEERIPSLLNCFKIETNRICHENLDDVIKIVDYKIDYKNVESNRQKLSLQSIEYLQQVLSINPSIKKPYSPLTINNVIEILNKNNVTSSNKELLNLLTWMFININEHNHIFKNTINLKFIKKLKKYLHIKLIIKKIFLKITPLKLQPNLIKLYCKCYNLFIKQY